MYYWHFQHRCICWIIRLTRQRLLDLLQSLFLFWTLLFESFGRWAGIAHPREEYCLQNQSSILDIMPPFPLPYKGCLDMPLTVVAAFPAWTRTCDGLSLPGAGLCSVEAVASLSHLSTAALTEPNLVRPLFPSLTHCASRQAGLHSRCVSSSATSALMRLTAGASSRLSPQCLLLQTVIMTAWRVSHLYVATMWSAACTPRPPRAGGRHCWSNLVLWTCPLSGVAPLCSGCSGSEAGTSLLHSAFTTMGPSPKQATVCE